MPQQIWKCTKCGSDWIDEQAASECEKKHIEPEGMKVLGWCPYERSGSDKRKYPKTIKVTMPDDKWHWNYGIYELTQIGPKAV